MIPAQPTGPVSSGIDDKLPGKIGITVGILAMVAGVIVGAVLVVTGALSMFDGIDELQRVPVGTAGTVEITETGSQSVYAERPSAASGANFSSGTSGVFVPDIQVAVEAPDGSPVVVSPRSGSETYEWNGREGVLIAQFEAPEAGTYRIRSFAGDGSGTYRTIAVGEALGLGGLFSILGGVFGGGLLVVLGLVILVISVVRRSSAKKRRAQAAQPWSDPGAGGWGSPPGSYGSPTYGQPSGPPGWVPPPAAPPPGGAPPAGGSGPAPGAPPASGTSGWPAPTPWPAPPTDVPPWQPPGQDPPR